MFISERIESRENARLVQARKVRDGRVRDLIFVEGRRLVGEALGAGLTIHSCFIADGFHDQALLSELVKRSAFVATLPERLFRSLADTEQPQGIVVIAARPQTSCDAVRRRIGTATLPLVVFLKDINNPSNLGAILRTAEAGGVAGVVVSAGSADPFSPKALRGAMGAAFRLPLWVGVSLDDALRWAGELELRTVAADVGAAEDHTIVDWRVPTLLVFGSEAHGLNSGEVDSINDRVLISMEPGVESLNLAVSAGIIIFEARRQNLQRPAPSGTRA